MILSAFKTTMRILRERTAMNNMFVRHRENVRRYFALELFVEDGPFPDTMVYLREMGSDEKFTIDLEHLKKYYVACSPFEAISSMSA